MSRVLLLATGGTIGLAPRPGRGAFAPGAELLADLPDGAVAADVVVEDVLAEPSWNLEPRTMLELARRARAAILEEGFDGVVVTHGTDTLEETAFLIDLLAGPAVPLGGIVVTGSMRPWLELSSDGPRNLASAIAAAADPALRGTGVVACLGDELHAARWVTKVDATTVGAFSSAPFPVLARVVSGRVEPLAAAPPRPPVAAGEPESTVALIKIYPGIDQALLYAAVDAGARGLVLEGTGAANVPVSLFTAIDELTTWDIPVVVASRCRTREVALDELDIGAGMAARVGAIGARGLAPSKARCALMVALGCGGGVDGVREWFGRL
jgi:L-asparaginase